MRSAVIVYAVVDDALSPDFPGKCASSHAGKACSFVRRLLLGAELEVFVRREDAQRFIEEVRGGDLEVAASFGSRNASWRRAG